jgi:hypothetical protein
MMITCPRCQTENSRWATRCKACLLVFDETVRGAFRRQAQAPPEPADQAPPEPAPPAPAEQEPRVPDPGNDVEAQAPPTAAGAAKQVLRSRWVASAIAFLALVLLAALVRGGFGGSGRGGATTGTVASLQSELDAAHERQRADVALIAKSETALRAARATIASQAAQLARDRAAPPQRVVIKEPVRDTAAIAAVRATLAQSEAKLASLRASQLGLQRQYENATGELSRARARLAAQPPCPGGASRQMRTGYLAKQGGSVFRTR